MFLVQLNMIFDKNSNKNIMNKNEFTASETLYLLKNGMMKYRYMFISEECGNGDLLLNWLEDFHGLEVIVY